MTDTARRRRPLNLIRHGRWSRREADHSIKHISDKDPDVRSIEYDGTRWIDIRNPTGEFVETFGERYGIHPLVLEDIMSRIQRPKIDTYDDYLFIVMQFTRHNKATRLNESTEIDMIIGDDLFVTIHDGTLRPLINMVDSVFESDEISIKLLQRTPGHLFYEVVDRMVDYIIPAVPRLEDRITSIEEMIFRADAMDTVQEISLVRRDLISMRRILKPQLPILNRLELGNLPFLDEDIDDYWGDIADHLARTLDSIEEFSEILASLSDTHDTLISHRMNEIIKTLTIFSVIMLPLTLLSGIFGMNVPLPFASQALTTVIIVIIMLLISIGMIIYFQRKRWL